ncbi:hypothetical protein AX15_003290 [Amanita polypyramis BW_CC]|nr:hypothetical protein AX15_003290 [Amanita polypyramis BW_CC]
MRDDTHSNQVASGGVWTTPPSPLTPLSTAPPSPTSPSSVTSQPELTEPPKLCSEEKEWQPIKSVPLRSPPSGSTHAQLQQQPLQAQTHLPDSLVKSDTLYMTSDDSMDVDIPEPSSSDLGVTQSQSQSGEWKQIEPQPLHSQEEEAKQGSLPSTAPKVQHQSEQQPQHAQQAQSQAQHLVPLQILQAQPQSLQTQSLPLPLQPQPLTQTQPQQQQQQQQVAIPSFGWYDVQEPQQQIIHWEDPPRLELVKNIWKFACKYRVWDVLCRYTPTIIRSVVAQEASDYHTTHGYPSGQLRLGARCRASGFGSARFRARRAGKALSELGGKRKRRRVDARCVGSESDAQSRKASEDGGDGDEDKSEDKEKEKGDRSPKASSSRHGTPEDMEGVENVEPTSASSPDGEREKFMDEEYYDWEIRSDGEEYDDDDDDDDEEDGEVFYYDEYDEDDDECFDEETESEEEEDGEGDVCIEDGGEKDKKSIERTRLGCSSSPVEPLSQGKDADDGMDVDSNKNKNRNKDNLKRKSRQDENMDDGEGQDEDDPSFNAELTTSLSCSSGDREIGVGCGQQQIQVQAPLPGSSLGPTSSPLVASESGSCSSPGSVHGQCATNGKAGLGMVVGRGDTLMSVFYCPPPHPSPSPQSPLQPQIQPQLQPSQQQGQLQTQFSHPHSFAFDPAHMRPPTPVPQQASNSVSLSPIPGSPAPSSLGMNLNMGGMQGQGQGQLSASSSSSGPSPSTNVSTNPASPNPSATPVSSIPQIAFPLSMGSISGSMGNMSMSMSLSNAPPAPPVVSLPPPRLSSIRVRPLRYGELGLSSVIGKGTPPNRHRAGEWARPTPEVRSGLIVDVEMSENENGGKGKERDMDMECEVVGICAERCGRSGEGGEAAVDVPRSEAQLRQEEEGGKIQEAQNQGQDDKMRIQVDGFEPDQSIWDEFFATLQPDAGEEVKHLGREGTTAGSGGIGVENERQELNGNVNPKTGEGHEPAIGDASGSSSVPVSSLTQNEVISSSTSGSPTGTGTVATSSNTGTTMNVFGMGFGLGLGMGFVSGSVNHVSLGFGAGSEGQMVNSMGWFGASPASPSPSAGPGSPSPSPSVDVSGSVSATGSGAGSASGSSSSPLSLVPGTNASPLYSNVADIDMGSVGVQAYLPLSMTMGMGGLGVGVGGMGVGMGVSVGVPMGMQMHVPGAMGVGVPMAIAAGAGIGHGHGQPGCVPPGHHSHGHGHVHGPTPGATPAAAAAAGGMSGGSATASSALSFALG